MNEQIAVDLFVYGGFVAAFFFLVFATIARKVRALKWFCLIGAFCGLAYTGGCIALLAGVGTATSGNNAGQNEADGIVMLAFIIAAIWSFVIVSLGASEKQPTDKEKAKTNERQENDCS